MRRTGNKIDLFLLPFALCGFAVAQPIYNLLLQTPVFLFARQNTELHIWVLTVVLSLLSPLIPVLPAIWLQNRWPRLALAWCWILSSAFASLFVAQFISGKLALAWPLYISLCIAAGALISWMMLFTRWSLLTRVLALPAVIFPTWFLLFSPLSDRIDNYAAAAPQKTIGEQHFPDVVFVLLDELPLATLMDNDGQVDASLFPGFARLQSISNWYYDSISVSDNTGSAVPAILTGRYHDHRSGLGFSAQPVNLFTLIRHQYDYNVAESVTRFCPQSLCPLYSPGHVSQVRALLLDLAAIYLHRVVPEEWKTLLPVVTNNWSGFFAPRQVFFPKGWGQHAAEQSEIDRPGFFNQFTDSIHDQERPVLNFMHILYPHEPNAYLPSGENYGLEWMRGQSKEVWGDLEWGVISGKQRHYLQVQHLDRLIGRLLDHLQQHQMLQDTLVVVVADHGISFTLNDTRREISDVNAAALLRVPLFIKLPGQTSGRRIEAPVMTIDILPTVLEAIGFSTDTIELDGADLQRLKEGSPRERFFIPRSKYEFRLLDDAESDFTALVAENRAHLKLDRAESGMWEIGPYDHLRGQSLEVICNKTVADFNIGYDGFQALPNTDPTESLPAFVVGVFQNNPAANESRPFLITSNNRLVASGHTWVFRGNSVFFALVEPHFVKQEDWQPKAWLLQDQQCHGAAD